MKYTVKQLMEMSQEDFYEICGGCIYHKCPFPKRLQELREDGFCIRECYKNAKGFIDYCYNKIERIKLDCKYEINKLKRNIKRYEKLIKEIEKNG